MQASDFIVSLGSFTNQVGSTDERAGTFMHELGHNLGLRHGGNQDLPNNKPQYYSVMNCSYQIGLSSNGTTGVVDCSRQSRSLDETALNENTAPDSGDRKYDTDDNQTTALTGNDDWSGIQLRGGSISRPGAPAGVPEPTPIDELTPQQAAQILPVDTVAPLTTATQAPPANANGFDNTDVTVTLSATDDSFGVARTEYDLDGGGWTGYTAPLTLTAEGTHTLLYRSTDRAQNPVTPGQYVRGRSTDAGSGVDHVVVTYTPYDVTLGRPSPSPPSCTARTPAGTAAPGVPRCRRASGRST
ncbi:OmpL47-type beta-barrel domain-containing protein [Kitasatospora sp. NPDC006697]|uniref:OmpL47-type beta-barrel domain-containing protein n=1 Tax=Kitasatospora sp. NPDC006697 TaxID=3364020 RepID=UPI0036C88BFB